MVKEIKPHTINDLYRNYFEEVYDFTNATNYKLSRTSSGIVFNYLSSSSGNAFRDIGIPNRTIDDIRKEGLNVANYDVSFSPPDGITKYTLCVIFHFWRNRSFIIKKKQNPKGDLLQLFYHSDNNKLSLILLNINVKQLTLPSDFNNKKIVIWLVEDFSQNITKVKKRNYSAILSLPSVRYANEQEFVFKTGDGVLSKIMFSPIFYDTDSEQYHKVMLQEKLNGSYVI